jgi:hypothetical protein
MTNDRRSNMNERRYAVYAKHSTEKVGYVHARDRKKAREAAAVEFGGKADDYFSAAAS